MPMEFQPPGLGRHYSPDPRDEHYPLRALLQPTGAVFTPKSRHWKVGPLLDQGQTGTCVAHAWKNWLNAKPLADEPNTPPTPFALYDQAILVDEWPDNDHDTGRQMGTSVRAGAKVLQEQQRIKSYVWAATTDELGLYVRQQSCVVFGTSWYSGMFTPDAKGVVKPTGGVVGGHAYLCCGYDSHLGLFEFFNSWGEWGYKQTGKFYLWGEDVDRLAFKEQGEVCDATEERIVIPKVPAPAAA